MNLYMFKRLQLGDKVISRCTFKMCDMYDECYGSVVTVKIIGVTAIGFNSGENSSCSLRADEMVLLHKKQPS